MRLNLTFPIKSVPKQRPLLLGIVGDSGSGKSTLIRGLTALFEPENVTEICLDDYHRYDRAERAKLGVTALNPVANNLKLMQKQLAQLKAGHPIFKPVYDHSIGTFDASEWVSPRQVIIVNGLFTLFNPQLANLFDFSIYLNPETELRLCWKTRRDTDKRGYSLAQVLQQIEERRADATAYVEPQKAKADLVVSFNRPFAQANEGSLDAHLYNRRRNLRFIIPARPAYPSQVVPSLRFPNLPLSQPASFDTLGLYQAVSGQWQQSYSLALTQQYIVGELLREQPENRLKAA